ncbi:MAG: DUF3370 domain-containing protein [Spirulinaceae cyanobacterium]
MFLLLPFLTTPQLIAQTPTPQEIVQPQEVRPLPGQLDNIPVFNSNSPELIVEPGILLSTFNPNDKATSEAHLNFPLKGRFDVFAHHVAKAPTPGDLRTLYLGIILQNTEDTPVTINIWQAASYLSQPDAPFVPLPALVENNRGKVYAGPGSRVMQDILRGKRQQLFPEQITIPPGETAMLLNLPIPVKTLEPPINGRSTYMRLESDGEVYAASLAMYAPTNEAGKERTPSKAEWEQLLVTGKLATPRDRAPTPPDSESGQIIYGRVAGVAQGSQWQATLTDSSPGSTALTIPTPGKAISYGLSTLEGGTYGTGQSQSAPLLVRYPDTAYKAHGNYGVQYNLDLPLYNPSETSQTVTIALQTPLKQDQIAEGLQFLQPPAKQVFFRGTVKVRYRDEAGIVSSHYYHLVQQRGQQGKPLATITIPPGEQDLVTVEFLYPPDSTPPQVLTIKTSITDD